MVRKKNRWCNIHKTRRTHAWYNDGIIYINKNTNITNCESQPINKKNPRGNYFYNCYKPKICNGRPLYTKNNYRSWDKESTSMKQKFRKDMSNDKPFS